MRGGAYRPGKMDAIRIPAIGLLFTLALFGCALELPEQDGGFACAAYAVASVMATVVHGDGAPFFGAAVTYTVDGSQPLAAQPMTGNEYVAGWEMQGDFFLYANYAGYRTAEATATVGMDEAGCHVVTQQVELILLPTP